MSRFGLGDRVGFKNDTELYGTIEKQYATAVDVSVWNGCTGEYERHHVARYKLWRDD